MSIMRRPGVLLAWTRKHAPVQGAWPNRSGTSREMQVCDNHSAQQNEDNRIASQEHLADEAILVHAPSLSALRLLRPHLFHVLEHHIAVAVKRLDSSK